MREIHAKMGVFQAVVLHKLRAIRVYYSYAVVAVGYVVIGAIYDSVTGKARNGCFAFIEGIVYNI